MNEIKDEKNHIIGPNNCGIIDNSIFDPACIFLIFTALVILLYPVLPQELVGRDSGEFALAVHEMGLSHPPGAPLLLIFARILRLFPGINPVLALSLISVLGLSFILFSIFRGILILTGNKPSAIISGLFLFSAVPFIKCAIFPETDALVMGFIALATIYALSGQKPVFSSFLAGAALCVHPMGLLALFPPFFTFLFSKPKKNLAKSMIIALILGLLPHLYSPIRGMKTGQFGLDNKANLFAYFGMKNFKNPLEMLERSPSITEKILSAIRYGDGFFRDIKKYMAPFIILAPLGIMVLFDENLPFLFVLFFISGLTLYFSSTAQLEYYLFPQYALFLYFAIALLGGAGLSFILKELSAYRFHLTGLSVKAFLVLFALYGAMGAVKDYNLSGPSARELWANGIFASCPKNALLFSRMDNRPTILEYMWKVKGLRPDIYPVGLGFFRYNHFMDRLVEDGIILDKTPLLEIQKTVAGDLFDDRGRHLYSLWGAEIARQNMGKRPIFVDFDDDPAFFHFMPQIHGMGYLLFDPKTRPPRAPNLELWQSFDLNFQFKGRDPELLNIRVSLLRLLDALVRIKKDTDNMEEAKFFREIQMIFERDG